MYYESFKSKLKKARKDTGFTQREVAIELKISKSTIASYETGRTQPDIEMLGTLVDFYGVSADWLIGTKGNNNWQGRERNPNELLKIFQSHWKLIEIVENGFPTIPTVYNNMKNIQQFRGLSPQTPISLLC